jgi:phospholipid-binding lipoprotein MlaA
VPSGPYLVLPLFGPSSLRDTTGMVVDRFMDPTSYISPWYAGLGVQGVRVIDGRAQLLGATSLIEAAALDRYSFLRDSYLQRRDYLIHDGNPPKKDEDEQDDKSPPAQPSSPEPGKPAAPVVPATPASPKAG